MGRPRGKSIYRFENELCYIICKHCEFIIDRNDYDKVKEFKWFSKIYKPTNVYYAYSHFKGNHKIILHRHLMNVVDSKIIVDHIDRNTLNNSRTNLRIATRLQNNVNSKKRKNCKSIYKGLTLRPSGNWGVYISLDGITYCLGTYKNEKEAALIYNKKALELFGKYAKLNEIN